MHSIDYFIDSIDTYWNVDDILGERPPNSISIFYESQYDTIKLYFMHQWQNACCDRLCFDYELFDQQLLGKKDAFFMTQKDMKIHLTIMYVDKTNVLSCRNVSILNKLLFLLQDLL